MGGMILNVLWCLVFGYLLGSYLYADVRTAHGICVRFYETNVLQRPSSLECLNITVLYRAKLAA